MYDKIEYYFNNMDTVDVIAFMSVSAVLLICVMAMLINYFMFTLFSLIVVASVIIYIKFKHLHDKRDEK